MAGCVLGPRCTLWDPDAELAGITESHSAPLCVECLRRGTADLRALPRDYAELAVELTPHERGLRHNAHRDDDTTTPLALHIEALQRDIFWSLTVWEPPVREAAGLPPERVRGVRAQWAVLAAANVLAPRARMLARLPATWCYAEGVEAGPVARDGPWALAKLRDLHRRAREACGLTQRVVDLPGECSVCGAATLGRADGSDTVRCRLCGDLRPYGEYTRYVGLMLEATT